VGITFKGRSFIRDKGKMELSYVAVVILASMVFVLSGMVGYLYWQQTRMLQHLQSLAVVISTQLVRPPEVQHEDQVEDDEMPALVPADDIQVPETVKEEEEVEEDDRLSVEKVEGPPAAAAPATDDLESKTAAQLRDLLIQKGIPFGKRDAKAVLIQLLKATA
jgi:hypothetical protein